MIALSILIVVIVGAATKCWDTEPVANFHFHTLWFQWNNASEAKAIALRKHIASLIRRKTLKHCSVTCDGCSFFRRPDPPYPIGSFSTCCNKSSVAAAFAFFSKNRGSLTIYAHPSTVHAILDHSTRSIWMGPSMPLDLSTLPVKRDKPLICNTGAIEGPN